MFAQQLDAARRITPADVDRYGVTADRLEAVKTRYVQWATDLRSQASCGPTEDPLRDLAEHMRASFPMPATETIRQRTGPQDKPPAQKPRDPDRGMVNRPGFGGGSGYWISTRVWSFRWAV